MGKLKQEMATLQHMILPVRKKGYSQQQTLDILSIARSCEEGISKEILKTSTAAGED